MNRVSGGLSGSRPTGQAPTGLDASRFDPGRSRPQTALFYCSTRVNGMGETDERGSYLRISIRPSVGGETQTFLISLGGAELLADEIAGALSTQATGANQ